MSLKKKKTLCPFSFVKAKTKGRKKAFSCESAVDPASSGKGYFYNQDELLREMKNVNANHQMEYEWEAVGWNEFTEAVLKFGWKKPKKNVCNIADVRRRRTVLVAALDSFLYKPSCN